MIPLRVSETELSDFFVSRGGGVQTVVAERHMWVNILKFCLGFEFVISGVVPRPRSLGAFRLTEVKLVVRVGVKVIHFEIVVRGLWTRGRRSSHGVLMA